MTEAKLYRDYTQAELDAQYNNRKRFPDYIDRFQMWADWSAKTRRKLDCHLDVAFGDRPTERLDIFPAEDAGAPIYVFVHGGYWYSLDKDNFSYVAEGMVPNGVTTVVTNYALAPDHDMDEIVRQNRAAIAWLYRNAADYGADPERIYVCGHSAGGHLVCMMMNADWDAVAPGTPANVVKGGCAVSGLFDLEPIRLSYLNQTLKMSADVAARNSPIRGRYRHPAPLLLALGADESDEYHRQTAIMDAFWRELGHPTETVIPDDLDHFSIVDSVIDPGADLVQRQLRDFLGR